MNRKIAAIAIMVAFVGGMFFAGTPVEAKKGGGGDIIDQVWAAISALDGRVTALENNSPEIVQEVILTNTSLDAFPKFVPQHLEYICPNNGVVAGSAVQQVTSADVHLEIQNAEFIANTIQWTDGYHGVEFDIQRTSDGASFVKVTIGCLYLQ